MLKWRSGCSSSTAPSIAQVRYTVLAVGRVRPPYVDAVEHYGRLLTRYARVDHEVDEPEVPGVVVSRVNLSPRFMRELIDAMEDNFSKWQTREGIRDLPEWGGGGATQSD